MASVAARIRTTVQRLHVHAADGGPFRFALPEAITVTVEESPTTADGIQRKIVVATMTTSVDEAAIDPLLGQLAISTKGSKNWTDDEWGEMVDPAPALRNVLLPVEESLTRAVEAVVNVLRWCLNQGAPRLMPGRFEIAFDDGEWWSPWVALASFPWPHLESEVLPATVQEIASRLAAGEEAPLGWELYHEALQLQGTSTRGSFVLAFTAAEVGVKEFAGRRSPSERWLLETIQSPPLDQMLSQYLCTFVTARITKTQSPNAQAVPDWIRRTIRDAAQKRNKVVHSPLGFDPDHEPTPEDTRQLLRAVADLLHLLDWFSGNDWARAFLSDETRSLYPRGDFPARGKITSR